MAATSDTGNQAKPLKTDRRVELDGGIDTRSGPLTIAPNKAINLGNFRLVQGGSLQKRQGASQIAPIDAYLNGVPPTDLCLVSDGGAGGTVQSGTYTVVVVCKTTSNFQTISTLKNKAAFTSAAFVLALNNRNLEIKMASPNNGEGLGRSPGLVAIDDPFNAGFILDGTTQVFAKKTGDPNFTLQSNVTVVGLDVAASLNGRSFVMTQYTTNGAVLGSIINAIVPIRALYWYPLIDSLIGVSAEAAWATSPGVVVSSAISYLARANDSAGNPFAFSRLPTRMTAAVVERCLIMSDGFGRPKLLDTPLAVPPRQYLIDLPTTWSFRQLGAAPPAAAPTFALAGGTLTGAYKYLVTFVFQRNRQDGTSFLSESNAGPSGTTNPATQQVTVTRPTANESGIVSWNLYRTAASGTTFFLLASVAIATTTFVDNTADGSLVGINPPDQGSTAIGPKFPNDIPPVGLDLITEFQGRGFGVQTQLLRNGTAGASFSQVIRVRRSNVVQYSKARFINDIIAVGGNFSVLTGDFGNIDAWPSAFNFPCGGPGAITSLVSFRGVLYVFKEDEIGVIEGQADAEFAYRTIWQGSGAMENSVVRVGNYLLAFDQALGPIMITGYSVEDLGYGTIQQDWITAITKSGVEAVSGGGRGSTAIISATWDTVPSEVRWVVSDYQVDPGSGTATGTAPTFFEYVLQMKASKPSSAFTRFTGSSDVGATGVLVDRRILAQTQAIALGTMPFRARDTVYGDFHGRLCLDAQAESDFAGTGPINVRATFPFFFGDSPEMVKLFRHIYMMFQMGTAVGDTLSLAIQSLVKGGTATTAVKTFNGSANTNLQQKRVDLPASIDGVNNMDRGVQVVISGQATSGPMEIDELSLKYQDVNERSAP